jgi:hypothetical protein
MGGVTILSFVSPSLPTQQAYTTPYRAITPYRAKRPFGAILLRLLSLSLTDSLYYSFTPLDEGVIYDYALSGYLRPRAIRPLRG